MPIVKVYGLPGNFNGHGRLAELKQLLAKTTADNIPNLPASAVTVFLVPDMDPDVGRECVIFVDGLFVKEERTLIFRKYLANRLVSALCQFLIEHAPDRTRLVECFVRPFNEEDGFAPATCS